MFTQCPECDTAFRVTAEVLKKAAGQVRCGGCGIAFNALEHLSEEMPQSALRAKPRDHVPELSPEIDDDHGQSVPRPISAKRSAALLKTLDELAGSNIEIEDTGVEWRVLDSNDSDDQPSVEEEAAAESQLITDTGSMKFIIENDDEDEISPGDALDIFEAPGATFIDSNLDRDSGEPIIDEYLTDSPTPVDQFLTATPNRVESPEVFADTESSSDSAVMRFDDNTPLPDDFDLDDPSPYIPEPPPVVERRVAMPEFEDQQVDLALGDPDEWEQLLGEVDESAAEPITAVTEEPAATAEISRDTSAATPPDMDTQFAIQAEAMGIDLSGMRESIESDLEATRVDDLDADVQDEQQVDDPHNDAQEPIELAADFDEDELELAARSDNEPDDEADQPDTVEPADTLLVSEEEEDEDEIVTTERDAGELELADEGDVDPDLATESAANQRDPIDELDETRLELDDEIDGDELILKEESGIDEVSLHVESEYQADDEIDDLLEDQLVDGEPETSIDEDLIAAAFETEAAQLEDACDEDELPEDQVLDDQEASAEHYVPPQTEEEMTINRMIDQDFMRLAAEGEDIFTSTITDSRPDLENNPNVETIIMEGEFVRTALDRKKLAADAAAGSRRYDDTKFSSKPAGNKAAGVRGGRREADPPAYGLIAAVVILGLVLVGQVLHQSREALATVPSFNRIAGPMYRMGGSPLTPTWDVTGWRFEVTTSEVTASDRAASEATASEATPGGTDEGDEQLTIYSRIGNTSASDLPYPLVHVSLTDRFEEIIGSKVLEPREYLTGNPDPRKAVAPGETFNAVIAIDSPAEDATGFKLNVCYRLANRQLRCAIEDFK